MKKIATILLAALLLVSLTACGNLIPGWPFGEPEPTECSHIPSEWIIDKEATCEAEGSQYKKCTVCDVEMDRETIAKAKHNTASDGDCTTADVCSVCGTVQVEACADHKYTDDDDTTCDNPGCEETREIGCKHVTEWIVEKEATCTEEGSKYEKCTLCEEVLNTEVIPLGHAGEDDGDCRTAVMCTLCGEVKTAAQEDHKYTNCLDTTCDNSGCEETREVNLTEVYGTDFGTDVKATEVGWNSDKNVAILNGTMSITHNATSGNTAIYRGFENNTKVTIEFDFALNYMGEDNQAHAMIRLRYAGANALVIVAQRHQMKIGSEWVSYGETWASGTSHKIMLVADTTAGTCDVYLDGVLFKEGAALSGSPAAINQLVLGAQSDHTGSSFTASYDNLLICK